MKRTLLMASMLLALMFLTSSWVRREHDQRTARANRLEQQQMVSPPVPDVASAAATVVSRPISFGLTFALAPVDGKLPLDVVGLSCHGEPRQLDRPHQDSCNPYQGDTSCRTVLPVLCIKTTGAPKPVGVQNSFYQGWVGGTLAATQAVMGAVLGSPAVATARCVAELGDGWRMAEFHDGQGGWGLEGHKGSGFETRTRYWVHINDQPGNCWNSEP